MHGIRTTKDSLGAMGLECLGAKLRSQTHTRWRSVSLFSTSLL